MSPLLQLGDAFQLSVVALYQAVWASARSKKREMHASSARYGILAVLLSSGARANPLIAPRAGTSLCQVEKFRVNCYPVTESVLDPWVSVDASGSPIATITPVLTTIDGATSTINAAPASLTATTASRSAPTSTGGGSYLLCHNTDGDFSPFCKPDNGSSVYIGETYYGEFWRPEKHEPANSHSDLGYFLSFRSELEHCDPRRLCKFNKWRASIPFRLHAK